MSSVSEDSLSTSQDIGYNPGDDVAPLSIPRGSGNLPARRATVAVVSDRMDPRAASNSALQAVRSRVEDFQSSLNWAAGHRDRLADDIDALHQRMDWFESPDSVANRLMLLERTSAHRFEALDRSLAELRGQVDLLVRL
jgi:hypothetical protein